MDSTLTYGELALIGAVCGFSFVGLLNAAYNLWPGKMVKVSQWLCRHKYQPWFKQRWLEHKRTKQHSRKQFRAQCCKCGKWTKWMPMSKQDQWAQENTSWLNGDRDE